MIFARLIAGRYAERASCERGRARDPERRGGQGAWAVREV